MAYGFEKKNCHTMGVILKPTEIFPTFFKPCSMFSIFPYGSLNTLSITNKSKINKNSLNEND